MKKAIISLVGLVFVGCSPLKSITQFETQNNNSRLQPYSYQMNNSTETSIYTHIATISPHILNGNKLQATGFDKDGSYAFISYNTEGNTVRGGLDILSVNSLQSPSIVSSIVSENSEYAEVKFKNNYLYMVGQKKDTNRNYALLTVIDVSNKSNPIAVEELVFTDGWYATSIDIEGNKAFITVPNVGVKEVDITNPLNVQLLSTKSADNALYVRRSGNRSVLVGGLNSHKVQILDSSLTTAYQMSSQQQEAPARFVISQNVLFSNGGNTGLTILDQINSSSPSLKSQTAISGRGNGINAGQCKKIYLAQGDQGLLTYDISNLSSPSFVGRFDFSGANEDCGSANNVFVANLNGTEYVFVADGLAGVKIVKVENDPSSCGCDNSQNQGLSCKVYDLSSTHPSSLPNFSSLTPVGTFTTNQLDVVAQSWQNSFTLFPNSLKIYKEWYGIVCEGNWTLSQAQSVEFSLGSDDGSKLYLDNTMIINNDGLHGPQTLTTVKNLSPKTYAVKVEYYQGPQTQIQLELKTKINNQSTYMTGFSH